MRYEFDSFNGGRLVVEWYGCPAVEGDADENAVVGMAGWHPPEKWPAGVSVPEMPAAVAGSKVLGKRGGAGGRFMFGEHVFQFRAPSPVRKRAEVRRLAWLHHAYAKECPPARAGGES